jgi:hypothetical protein
MNNKWYIKVKQKYRWGSYHINILDQ